MDFIRRRWLKSKISHNHDHNTGTQSYKLHNYSKRYAGDLEFIIDNSSPDLFSQTPSVATASDFSSKPELAMSKSMISISQVVPFNEPEQDNLEQSDMAILPTSARKVILRRRFKNLPVSGELWKLNEIGTILDVDLTEGKSCNSDSVNGIRWFEFYNTHDKKMNVRLFYNDTNNNGFQGAKIEYYAHSTERYDEEDLQCIKQDLVGWSRDLRRSMNYLVKLMKLEDVQSFDTINQTETAMGVIRDEKEQEDYRNNYQELKSYAMEHTELAAKTVENCYNSAINSLNSGIYNLFEILHDSSRIQNTSSVELRTPRNETSELEPLINQPLVYSHPENDSKLAKLFNLFRYGSRIAPFNNYFLSTFPIRLPQSLPQETIDETQRINVPDLPMNTPRSEISDVKPMKTHFMGGSRAKSAKMPSMRISKTHNRKPNPDFIDDPKQFLAKHILNNNNPNGEVLSGIPMRKKRIITPNLENGRF